jgi:hypothetical protein
VSTSLSIKAGFINIQHISFLYGSPPARLPLALHLMKGTQMSLIIIDADHDTESSSQPSRKKEKSVIAELRALVQKLDFAEDEA